MTTGPLRDVRLVELTSGVPGQIAGLLLADLGAEVVRRVDAADLEARETDLAGWLFRNRGKTLARCTDDVEDLARLRNLTDRADVVLTDATPSVASARGWDATTIRTRSPRTIHAWAPPVAPRGRLAELPADDLLIDALGGFSAHHPSYGERPVASVVPGRLYFHGALIAAHVVASIVGRDRDGHARPVVVGGLHAEALVMLPMFIRREDDGDFFAGSRKLTAGVHFRLYRASDGKWVFLASLSETLFIEALNVLGRLDILEREDVAGEFVNLLKPEVTAEVGPELEREFASRPSADWIERFRAADVPLAPVSDREEWLASEIIAFACPPTKQSHAEVGELIMPGVPVALSTTPGTAGRAPALSDVMDLARVVDDALSADRWPALSDGPKVDPVTALTETVAPPLHGMEVLDTSTFLAAPTVGALLVRFGATVSKLESPSGDPYRTYGAAYSGVNYGKRREVLSFATEDGRADFLARVAQADVLIDNLRPASLDRLRLDAETLAAVNGRLVRCSLTAYGHAGPWVEFPGFDPIMQSLSGLAAVQGGDDRPVATGCPVHDFTAGTLGTLGVLAALHERHHSGRGQRVTTSLAAASTLLQCVELTSYAGRPKPPVGGRDFDGPAWWKRLYLAGDRWIAVAAVTPRQRERLLEIVQCDGDEVSLVKVISTRTATQWLDAFGAAGVPACLVTEYLELDNPSLVELGHYGVIDAGELGRFRVARVFGEWPTVRSSA